MLKIENHVKRGRPPKDNKQDEWRVTFCDWIKSLPYSNLITGEEK